MLDEIRAKRDEIYAIARRRKAEKLWVFGSCARCLSTISSSTNVRRDVQRTSPTHWRLKS
ncbi:MAG: hypothetical protein IJ173_05445 [Kiritimatiellae bacterium]|nr:hypothetical protein [Kiritimatiellia bacterium]